MLVVKIELHSAITGQVTEIGRTYIWNEESSGDPKIGHYAGGVCRKNDFRPGKFLRKIQVKNYPRLSYNVWRLVIRALRSAFPEET